MRWNEMPVNSLFNSSTLGIPDAALNETSSTPITARVTTLCVWRLCVGFQSVLRPTGESVNETPTDFMSASVVVSAAFLFVLLLSIICVVAMELTGIFLRTASWWYIRLCSQNTAHHSNLVTLFEILNANCPLIPTAIPVSTCSICLDDMVPPVVTRRLRCSHTFHAVCIDRWLLQALTSGDKQYHFLTRARRKNSAQARCPVCNAGAFSVKECRTKLHP